MKGKSQTKLKEVVTPLLEWYDQSARILPWRESPTPYRVWVSEIMLQQTRVEAVKVYFDRFIKELPNLPSLAMANEERLMKLWEGLGYYNRVRNMQKAARMVMEVHHGNLPDSYEALIRLPGIGDYTAGAIASIAYGVAIPAVDGNVLRVVSRILASNLDIMQPTVKKAFRSHIIAVLPKDRAGDFNQALMELGATVCLPNGMPLCERCPVATCCNAYQQNCVMQFPVKSPKKPRRMEERTIFIIQFNGKTALHKRPDKGLLAKMWELPNIEGDLSVDQADELLVQWGITAKHIETLGNAKHIFTHIEWFMTGYRVAAQDETLPLDWEWADQKQMKEGYALPSAFTAYMPR